MEPDKVIAVMGSPGSGKTTAALKLALALAAEKKNVIVVFCDPFTPVIPTVLPAGTTHDTSLGSLLTAPALTQTTILNACVPVKESEHISFLGYRVGESLMMYPQITRDKAVDFFVLLRHLADYVIIDCASTLEADPASIVGIEFADRVLKLGTANLRGVSYFMTHSPMLADSRFRKDTHSMIIGNLKAGQDWEAAAQQYGGADGILPYAPELELQYDELALLLPLTQPESAAYTAAIEKLLGLQPEKPKEKTPPKKAAKKEKTPPAAKPEQTRAEPDRKPKSRPVFRLPFGRNRGEF